jgi:hypothetical protein
MNGEFSKKELETVSKIKDRPKVRTGEYAPLEYPIGDELRACFHVFIKPMKGFRLVFSDAVFATNKADDATIEEVLGTIAKMVEETTGIKVDLEKVKMIKENINER